MAQVTSPIILDSTGQQIHSDLQQIKNVLTTPSAAENITFDNTGTGMQADDVQDAITELKSNLTDFSTATLLGDLTTDNVATNITDISNYKVLALKFKIDSDEFAIQLIPTTLIVYNKKIWQYFRANSSNYASMSVTFNSATSATINKFEKAGWSSLTASIYGFN